MIWSACDGKNPVEDNAKPWRATIDVVMAVAAPKLCCSRANNGHHVDNEGVEVRASPRFLLTSVARWRNSLATTTALAATREMH